MKKYVLCAYKFYVGMGKIEVQKVGFLIPVLFIAIKCLLKKYYVTIGVE